MEFVNVIVDISHEKLDRIFQYRIPEELQGKISTGMQVQVPFGMGNRTIKGYVTGVTDVPDYPVEKIKPVTGLVDGAVPAESELIALAAWMKEFYGSTMNQALKTVLPVKQEVSSRQEKCIVLAIPREEAEQLLKEVLHKNFRAKARLLAGLLDHGGKLSSKEAADLKITSSVIQGLERDGVVRQISRVQYRNPFAGKFEQIGITCEEMKDPDTRKLIFVNEELKLKFFLAKGPDVPTYVEYGAADIGIVGKDTILEEGRRMYEVLDLGYGKCRMCVCGPESAKELLEHQELIRVATKYPHIAKDYFYNRKHQTVEIIKLNGSIELAPIVGLSEVIVDIVETGSTLRENGLQVLEEVCPLSARMVVNQVSMKMENERIGKLIADLKAVL